MVADKNLRGMACEIVRPGDSKGILNDNAGHGGWIAVQGGATRWDPLLLSDDWNDFCQFVARLLF